MDNYVYVSVTTDSSDIKKGSLWYMVLKSEKSALYIETPHKAIEENKDIFNNLMKHSYFRGLAEADAKLEILKLNDEEDFFPVTAFTSQDKNKQIDKIVKFLEEVYLECGKNVTLVFENSFDYIFFLNEAFTIKDGNVIFPSFVNTGTVIVETFLSLIGEWNYYLQSKNNFINDFIKVNKENDMYIIIERMGDLLKVLALEDICSIIFESINGKN